MDDRGARHAENFLSRSFRDALADLDIDELKLHALSQTYLKNGARQLAAPDGTIDENKLANDKGNLKKEMEKDILTIKVYLKLWRILRPKSMTITVNAEWHDGKKLNGGKGFTYSPLELDDEDEIDEEFIRSFRATVANHYERMGTTTTDTAWNTISELISSDEEIPETVDVN